MSSKVRTEKTPLDLTIWGSLVTLIKAVCVDGEVKVE